MELLNILVKDVFFPSSVDVVIVDAAAAVGVVVVTGIDAVETVADFSVGLPRVTGMLEDVSKQLLEVCLLKIFNCIKK